MSYNAGDVGVLKTIYIYILKIEFEINSNNPKKSWSVMKFLIEKTQIELKLDG